LLRVCKLGSSNTSRVKSKTEILAPVASLVSPRHSSPRTMTGGWEHVYLWHGTSVCWHTKTQLESGPVTADLATTVKYSYQFADKQR